MRSMDTFTKRIVMVAAAISMVLLSLSVFIYSTQKATAQIIQPTQPNISNNPAIVGLGADMEFIYYAVKVQNSPIAPGISIPGSNYILVKASKKDAAPRDKALTEEELKKATLVYVDN